MNESTHEIETETDTETEAARVHRRLVESFQSGRRGEGPGLIDDDVIDHRGGTVGDHHGLAAWREDREHMYDGLSDVSVTVEQNVASGEFSTNRYTLRATHDATGRRYEVTGIDMVRVKNGKLVEHWALMDTAAMRHQLGLDQA